MKERKKLICNSLITLLLFVTLTLVHSTTTFAVEKELKLSMFKKLTTATSLDELRDSKDTPEGFCIAGNTAYITKIHKDGTTTLIKIPDLSKPDKKVYPAKNLNLGHANDLAYYNGYLYVAGLDGYIYRIKDKGKNSSGKEEYGVKAYEATGLDKKTKPEEQTWNITHFSGKYFIICSRKAKNSLDMTFHVGYFDIDNKNFVTTKTFKGTARAFSTIQGLTYANGYLYLATSDNDGTFYKNKISIYHIGTSYSGIVNGKHYPLNSYGTFDNNETKSKFEIESLDITKDGYIYILMNIKKENDPIYVSKKSCALK